MSRNGNRNHVILPQIEQKKSNATDFQNENYNFVTNKKKAVGFKDVKEDVDYGLVDELKRKVEEQRKDIEQRNQAIFSIQRNFESLSTILKNEKSEGQAIRDELQRQKESNLELLKRVQVLGQRNQEIEHQNELQKKEIANFNELSKRLQSYENDKQSMQAKLTTMKSELDIKTQAHANCARQLSSKDSEIDRLNEQLSRNSSVLKQENQLALQEKDNQYLALQVQSQKIIDDLKQINESQKRELEQLQELAKTYQNNENEIVKLQSRIHQIKGDLDSKTTLYYSCSKQVQIHEQTIEKLNEQIAMHSLISQQDKLNSQSEQDKYIKKLQLQVQNVNLEDEIKQLNIRLTLVNKTSEECQTEYEKLLATMKQQKQTFQQLQQTLVDNKQLIKEHQQSISENLEVIQQQDQQIEQQSKIIDQLRLNQSDLSSENSQIISSIKLEYETKIDTLTKQGVRLKGQLEAERKGHQILQQTIKQHEDQISELQSNIIGLQELINTNQDSNSRQQQLVHQLNDEIQSLKSQVAFQQQEQNTLKINSQQQIEQLNNDCTKLRELLSQGQSELSWMKEHFEGMKIVLEQTKQQLSDAESRTGHQQAENEKLIKSLKTDIETKNILFKSSQQDLISRDDQIYKSNLEIKSLNASLKKLQEQYDALDPQAMIKKQQSVEAREQTLNDRLFKITHALDSTITAISCGQCMETITQTITCVPCGHSFCSKCTQGYTSGCSECSKGSDNYRNKQLDDVIAKIKYSQSVIKMGNQ